MKQNWEINKMDVGSTGIHFIFRLSSRRLRSVQ